MWWMSTLFTAMRSVASIASSEPMLFTSTLMTHSRGRPFRITGPPRYFYPRSPRGERRLLLAAIKRGHIFLSTLPARGATTVADFAANVLQFLSTLPARGATLAAPGSGPPYKNFYPRSPRGERPARSASDLTASTFLSTLPARGATRSLFW